MLMRYFCLFILLSTGYISYSQNKNVEKGIRYYLYNSSEGRRGEEKFMSEFQFDSLIKIANNKNMVLRLSVPRSIVNPELIMGNDTLLFSNRIPREWFSKFIELLCTEDKDWLANVFMYQIANRNGLTLVRYRDNNYERWKKERKKKEVKEWKKWKG
jgi:hypothetical protein